MRSVLITSGGSFQGLGLLEALQQLPSVRPVIADIHADNVTRYLCADYHAVPPIAERSAYCSALFRLVRQEDVTTIFPATARELPLLAKLRPQMQDAGVCVAVSSVDLVDALLDKAKSASWLRDHGLPAQMPIDPLTHDFAVGLFGKPRAGWGGSGTIVARTLDTVRRNEMADPSTSIIWFPLVEDFEEFSADFAVTASGQRSPVVLRKRLRTSGGFAVISESTDDAALHDISTATAASLIRSGARGLFNMQMIRQRDGDVFVSDVNPRFGTSAVHGLSEGVNLPGFYLAALNEAERSAPVKRQSVKTIRYLKTVALPKLLTRPKGVVFDLDDTLVDHKLWMSLKADGAYRAVARRWVGAEEFQCHVLQLIDEGERSQLIDRLAGHFSWTREQHEAFLAAYRSAPVEQTPLFPDVAPVLAALNLAGFRLAVLTDNPPATQRAKIEHAKALSVISTIVYARETGHEKPSPAAYAAAASSLALAPADLCMVGDNYFRDAMGAVLNGYAAAMLVTRPGTFVQPHAGLAELIDSNKLCDRIHRIENLYILRDILLS